MDGHGVTDKELKDLGGVVVVVNLGAVDVFETNPSLVGGGIERRSKIYVRHERSLKVVDVGIHLVVIRLVHEVHGSASYGEAQAGTQFCFITYGKNIFFVDLYLAIVSAAICRP